MTWKAQVQSTFGIPAHFFLYTFNSPCCEYEFTCLQKIFKFTFDEIYDNAYRPYHSMNVLLYKWYINKVISPSNEIARKNFCKYVQDLKDDDQYHNVDFFNVLSF